MVDRFQHLFDSLTEEVVVVDRDLRIGYANPAWIRRVGLPSSGILGHKCHHVLLDSSAPCAAETCAVQQVLKTGQAVRLTCQGLKEKTGPGWGELSASPVFDATGQVSEVIQILHPPALTAGPDHPPRLSEEERRRHEIADALREIVLITGSSQGLQAVLDAILDQLSRVVDFDAASITLVTDRGSRIIASRGFPPDVKLDEIVFPADDEKIIHMQETRQPLIIHDVQADERWTPVPGTEFIRSWIGSPLLAQGRMIGTLNVDKVEAGYYRHEDAELVIAFANQVAVVIENARLLEAERQRAAHLSLISGISQHILSILDSEALLSYIVEAIHCHFGYHVDVFLTDPSGEHQVFRASSHAEFAACWREEDLRFRTGEEGIIGYVAATGQPCMINDVRQEPRYVADAHLTMTRSELAVPIKVGEHILGVLDLNSDQLNAFDEKDVFVAQSLADHLALGLENARLYEAARQHVAELEAVRQAGLSLTASLELQAVLETILRSTLELLSGVQDAHVFLYQGKRLIFGAALWADGRTGHPWSDPRPNGLTYTVAQRGELIFVPDMQTHPLFESAPAAWEGAIIGLPLKIGDRVVGVMSVAYREPHELVDSELRVLQMLADQAAIAIENARLFEETKEHIARLEKKTRDLEVVHEVSRLVSSSLDLNHVLDTAAKEVVTVFGADHSGIMLFDEERRHGQVLAEHPSTGAVAECIPVEGYLGAERMIAERQPLMIKDVQDDPLMAALRETMQRLDIRSMLIVPLIVKGEVIGSIGLDAIGQRRQFDDEEVALAQTIANQVAYAVENARLYQETQQRLRELSLLFDTSAAISTSLDPDLVLQTTTEQIIIALGVEGCAVSIWDREQDALVNMVDYARDPVGWKPTAPRAIYPLADYPLSRTVLTARLPVVVQASDPEADRAELAWMLKEEVRSLLMVPMVVRDSAIGLLELMESGKEREFTSTEVNLCQTLANQAAAAWENARLFQQTEARAREMGALAAVGQAMTTLELDDVLHSIAENASEAAQAEISSVYLLDDAQKRLIPQSVWGMHHEELRQAYFELGEGTIGWVAQAGQALIVHDTTTESMFAPKTKASEQIRNTLTVPLAVKGQVIGTLEVCNKIGGEGFTVADQRLLTAFAAQAAVAIDNARLYQEVSQHLDDALILNRVAAAATSTLDLDQVIRRGLTALLGVRNFERVQVMLVDRVHNDLWLHPALAQSVPLPDKANLRIPLGKGITGWVAQSGESLRLDDVRQESRYLAGYPDTLSELCVPLRVGDRIIGVLDAQSTRLDAFSENDQRLLTTLGGQLCTVIENARLFEEAQRRVRELTALMQVSQALNEAKDLQTTLDIVLKEAFALLDSQEGSIILIDPPGSNRLFMVAEQGLGPELVEAFNRRPVYTHEGTYRRALRSGHIIEVADISTDPDFLHDVGSRAKTITNIPLMTERGAIGLIALDGLPSDDNTRRLLTALADMAAVAIDKERLHQETSGRLAEVSTLYTLSTQITSSLSLSSVLGSIVTILKLTLDCRSCSIFLVDPTGQQLRLEAASGPSSTWKGVAQLKVGEGISGRVIAERRSIYVPDTQLEPDFIFFDPGIRSLLVVPLIVRDRVIGTLSIDDTVPNAFHEEVRLLTIAAAQAAAAIENAQLYESLQSSYGDLERAYDELRELDKMKSELVQNVSHELRTPLTFIKGYVELLQDGEMGELQDEQNIALDIVANKAEVLSRLVDDIISMQQAGREQLRFEFLSLADVGHVAVQAAQASAADAGIPLHDEIPDGIPPVLGDKQRLGQVFDNLIQNAIKFSHRGDSVTVRMYVEETMVRTEVEDTGIGIPADQLTRIFERFYQVDGTTTRRVGGTGLGLAIAKQIVEVHNGRVGVESEMGQGSLFYFEIPIAHTDEKSGG